MISNSPSRNQLPEMRSFGGHGYSHILRNIPELFKRLGFDKNMLKKLIHENPLKVLSLKEV